MKISHKVDLTAAVVLFPTTSLLCVLTEPYVDSISGEMLICVVPTKMDRRLGED